MLNLPEEAPSGAWIIQTETRGQIQNYTFFVDYYSLALANVTIDIPQFIKFGEKIGFKISSFYTFGKPVEGEIEVNIIKIDECGKPLANQKILWQNTTTIHGQENFVIDMMKYFIVFSSNNCSSMSFNISAKVKDKNIDNFYYNYQTFEVIRHDFTAHIDEDISKYRPGKFLTKKVMSRFYKLKYLILFMHHISFDYFIIFYHLYHQFNCSGTNFIHFYLVKKIHTSLFDFDFQAWPIGVKKTRLILIKNKPLSLQAV